VRTEIKTQQSTFITVPNPLARFESQHPLAIYRTAHESLLSPDLLRP